MPASLLFRALVPPAVCAAAIPSAATAQPAEAWEIGPIIRSKNYSVGMPPHPTPTGRGWFFDFPYPNVAAGHVHYVSFRAGLIPQGSRIVVRYRVDAPRGVRFVPQETPDATATISLFLQRRGDNWSARGRYEFYRWYAPPHTVREIAPGEHEISISLDDGDWGSVMGRPASAYPEAFADALANLDRIGLVFGSAGARGHGVYSTGPARFTLMSFRILD